LPLSRQALPDHINARCDVAPQRCTESPLDHGEAIHLPDASHWRQHKASEEVNRMLLDFLT